MEAQTTTSTAVKRTRSSPPPSTPTPPNKFTRTSVSSSQSLSPSTSPSKSKHIQSLNVSTPDSPTKPTHTRRNTPLICTLPPTCTRHPVTLPNSAALEAHYATHHTHICALPSCGCVFPDERLLELHQTECHDPLAALRKDRGEKIFACHLATCPRLFLTPKARRLHLITLHGFPKEYFFAVTNKGIGGLLKKWGAGASLIRGTWKRRVDSEKEKEKGMEVDDGDETETEEGDESSESGTESDDEMVDMPAQKQSIPPPKLKPSPAMTATNKTTTKITTNDRDTDELTQALSALSLVPPSIRFGRGGKNGGFSRISGGRPRGY